jgi:CTP:molybdopterin cytidylyltransferase MocA
VKRAAARIDEAVACVLLAAGGSRRLGHSKQLVRYRTRPLLLHAVAAVRAALPRAPLVVVVGAEALRMRLVLRRADCGARIVANSRWHEGMAVSLRKGLAATPRSARAALLLLVDQPLVTSAQLERLVTAWRRRPGSAAAARYDGHAGAPAIVPRRRWAALKTLRGDQGARALLRASTTITLIDMPQAALDVDTAADLRRLTKRP